MKRICAISLCLVMLIGAFSIVNPLSLSSPSSNEVFTASFNDVYNLPEFPFGHEWDTGDGQQVYNEGWGGDVITVWVDVALDPQARLYIKYDYCNHMACYDGEPGGWDDMDFRNASYVLGWEMNYVGGTIYNYTLIGDWMLGYPTYPASNYSGIHVGYTVYAKNTTDGSVVVGEQYQNMFPYWPAHSINVTSTVSKTVLDPGENFWVNGTSNYWHRLNWHDNPPANECDVTVTVNPTYQDKTDAAGNFSMMIPAPMTPGFHTVNTTVSNTTENRNATCVSNEITIEVTNPITPHLPIRINSNADFDSAHGVANWATGNGTVWNPWIIERWDINGTGLGYCIFIGNTTEYFVVRDCYLHNADSVWRWPYITRSGLYLYNVQNGQLIHNTISNNQNDGIYVISSNSNTLTNNTASGNQDGIYFSNSDGNTLMNNNASSNNYDGISFRDSDSNMLINNTASSNYYDGIALSSSSSITPSNNTLSKNTVSNNLYGICLSSSSSNTFTNNTVSSNNEIGIYIASSISNTLRDNMMINDGIFIEESSQLSHWNTHTIDTSNKVNGKPVYYWKNQTGGTVPPGAGEVILANCTGVTVENQNVSDGSVGIELGFSSNNTMSYNTASNNYYGIYLWDSDCNTLINNTASSNTNCGIYLEQSISNTLANNTASSNNVEGIYLEWGSDGTTLSKNTVSNNFNGIYLSSSSITLSNNTISYNTFGIYVGFSFSSLIYHNRFINNTNQAFDNGTNFWNHSYPAGGNYWSDYIGDDIFSGPDQDIPGSDGFGDTNYTNIIGGNVDEYPLMSLSKFIEYDIPLQEGWNLVSLPLVQSSKSIIAVLASIDGKWDCIRAYDAINEIWLSNVTSRPDSLNDIQSLNHKMGFWININETNVNLTVRGYMLSSTSISLYAGWNLIGYPSLNIETIANALWGTSADNVMVCDTSEPYNIKEVGPNYVMQPGEGYWVHVPFDTVWVVDW